MQRVAPLNVNRVGCSLSMVAANKTAHIGEVFIKTTTTLGGALSRAITKVNALRPNNTALPSNLNPLPLMIRVILMAGKLIEITANMIAGTRLRIVAAMTGEVPSSPITVERNPTAHNSEVITPSAIPV